MAEAAQMSDFSTYLDERCQEVDAALDRFLPKEETAPETLHKAMRYSIFAGGKRLRPVLTLAAAEACGGRAKAAMPAACAVEILHTYTLVHDDLPCMDDDDLRRGRPTSHKVYGEGVAVLAGDALLTEAMSCLAQTEPSALYRVRDYIIELCEMTGSKNLIGGQVMDLEGEGRDLTVDELRAIHNAKTAALLTSSIRLGAMSAGANNEKLNALTKFGQALGLAFQVIDDILDVTASTEKLGKTAGKDENVSKATYPAVIGLEAARQEAKDLTTEALAQLEIFGEKGERLSQIAHYLLDRDY